VENQSSLVLLVCCFREKIPPPHRRLSKRRDVRTGRLMKNEKSEKPNQETIRPTQAECREAYLRIFCAAIQGACALGPETDELRTGAIAGRIYKVASRVAFLAMGDWAILGQKNVRVWEESGWKHWQEDEHYFRRKDGDPDHQGEFPNCEACRRAFHDR